MKPSKHPMKTRIGLLPAGRETGWKGWSRAVSFSEVAVGATLRRRS
jgi:hypothetical protein